MINVYAVKDDVSGSYNQPFLMVNDQIAVRGFKTLAEDTSTDIGKYPTDFSLYRLGEYDEKTGVILSNVEFLVTAINLLEVKK